MRFYKQMDHKEKLKILNDVALLPPINQIVADYAFFNDYEFTWDHHNSCAWTSTLLPDGGWICSNGIFFAQRHSYIEYSCDFITKECSLKNFSVNKLLCHHRLMFLNNAIFWNTSIKSFHRSFPKLPLELISQVLLYFHSHFTEFDAMIVIATRKDSILEKYIIDCGFVNNFATKVYEAQVVQEYQACVSCR